jgi:hypothetical protein
MSELAQRPLPLFHEDPAIAAHHDEVNGRADAKDASTVGNYFKYPGGVLKTIDSAIKGIPALAKDAPAAAATSDAATRASGVTAGLLGNGLSAGSGLLKFIRGTDELTSPDTRTKGVTDMIGGVSGLGSGLLGMLDLKAMPGLDGLKKAVSPGLSMVTGAMQVAGGVSDWGHKGLTVDNFVDMASGTMGLGGGVASAITAGGGATAAAASTVGAGLTGAPIALAGGAALGGYMNDLAEGTSRGHFGRDEHGRERTAQDAAVDTGLSVEAGARSLGLPAWMANGAGATASMGASVANVGISAAKNLFGYLTE